MLGFSYSLDLWFCQILNYVDWTGRFVKENFNDGTKNLYFNRFALMTDTKPSYKYFLSDSIYHAQSFSNSQKRLW